MNDEHQRYYLNMTDEQSVEYIQSRISLTILELTENLNTNDPLRITGITMLLNNLTSSADSYINDFKNTLKEIGLAINAVSKTGIDSAVNSYQITWIQGKLSEKAIENNTVEKKKQYLKYKYPNVKVEDRNHYIEVIEKYQLRPLN